MTGPEVKCSTLRRCAVLPILLAMLGIAVGCSELEPRTRNLVLVTVDTLRPDRLGVYGYEAAKTPVFDQLAAESVRFERAYAHSSLTLPSITTLLTGRLPAAHGLASNGGTLSEGIDSLTSVLRAAGFRTAAFIGSFALRSETGLSRGFESYTDRYLSKEYFRPENPASFLTDGALVWLADLPPEERFFLWIHYQEPHGPYIPPGFVAPPPTPGEPELPMSDSNSGLGAIPRYQWLGHGRLSEYKIRYDAEIAEMDRQLGRLLAGLRRRGLFDDTLLVVTADHGEAFGEEDLFLAHGEGLGEVQQRVPLLLRVPGLAPRVRQDRVGLTDVAPTLLKLLGVDAGGVSGVSLLEEVGDRTIIAQVWSPIGSNNSWRSILDGEDELVQGQPVPGMLGLRTKLRGPETSDPEVVARLRVTLNREARWPDLYGKGQTDIDPADREALRAMGYLD